MNSKCYKQMVIQMVFPVNFQWNKECEQNNERKKMYSARSQLSHEIIFCHTGSIQFKKCEKKNITELMSW